MKSAFYFVLFRSEENQSKQTSNCKRDTLAVRKPAKQGKIIKLYNTDTSELKLAKVIPLYK